MPTFTPHVVRVAALLAAIVAFAQPRGIIFGEGYKPPRLQVAPGQVLTIYATGVGEKITKRVRAEKTPWPTELAGISVDLTFFGNTPAPLAQVEPFSTCPRYFDEVERRGGSCGRYLAITLQIPQMIRSMLVGQPLPTTLGLVIRENGEAHSTTDLEPQLDRIHFLRTCDAAMLPYQDGGYGFPGGARLYDDCFVFLRTFGPDGLPLQRSVREGDTVVIHAYGLGTDWADGQSPPPIESLVGQWPVTYPSERFRLHYAFGGDVENGSGSVGDTRPLPWDYLGPVAGEVGLFQLNFKMPPIPKDLAPCARWVRSNFGIRLSTSYPNSGGFLRQPGSGDTIGFCVDPGTASTPQ
ncbi:MAG: hypothetical protein R2729_17050 [Bryobacteraceae bacterium]